MKKRVCAPDDLPSDAVIDAASISRTVETYCMGVLATLVQARDTLTVKAQIELCERLVQEVPEKLAQLAVQATIAEPPRVEEIFNAAMSAGYQILSQELFGPEKADEVAFYADVNGCAVVLFAKHLEAIGKASAVAAVERDASVVSSKVSKTLKEK